MARTPDFSVLEGIDHPAVVVILLSGYEILAMDHQRLSSEGGWYSYILTG